MNRKEHEKIAEKYYEEYYSEKKQANNVEETHEIIEEKTSILFDNIGGKLKGLAKFICYLGMIVSVIAGFYYLSSGGILIIIVGSLLSWIGSFFTYGFGELICKVTEIAENTKADSNKEDL